MNNVNTRVEIRISGKLTMYSPAWTESLRTAVQTNLQAMQRTFSEIDFLEALKTVEATGKLNLAGVTFLIYTI